MPTGLAITAIGLVSALAVHIHAGGVNVQAVGMILVALGLTWLWVPVRHKRALLRRQFARVMAYLAWDPSGGSTVRCSLAELLERRSGEIEERPAD